MQNFYQSSGSGTSMKQTIINLSCCPVPWTEKSNALLFIERWNPRNVNNKARSWIKFTKMKTDNVMKHWCKQRCLPCRSITRFDEVRIGCLGTSANDEITRDKTAPDARRLRVWANAIITLAADLSSSCRHKQEKKTIGNIFMEIVFESVPVRRPQQLACSTLMMDVPSSASSWQRPPVTEGNPLCLFETLNTLQVIIKVFRCRNLASSLYNLVHPCPLNCWLRCSLILVWQSQSKCFSVWALDSGLPRNKGDLLHTIFSTNLCSLSGNKRRVAN